MIDWRCPACGFYRDTPNHKLGCPMDNNYIPLQVRFGDNPRTGRIDGWRVLAICILLNRTSRVQVARVLPQFFAVFPFALFGEIATYDHWSHEVMERTLTPLGFGHTRSTRIASMSKEWLDHEDWRRSDRVSRFTGCGQYAVDAFRIFVEQGYSVPATDRVLESYRRTKATESCPRCGVPGAPHTDTVGCADALIAFHAGR